MGAFGDRQREWKWVENSETVGTMRHISDDSMYIKPLWEWEESIKKEIVKTRSSVEEIKSLTRGLTKESRKQYVPFNSLTLQNSLQSKNGEKESDVSSFIQPVKYNGKLTTTPKYKFYYPIRKKIT